ncbi:MAG: asparagine synthetase B, partial [Bacteroidales bacterium]|nr:asparagine synthetase B [Bacteroidales bacterium]
MATCRFKPSVWRTLWCGLLCGLTALMPLRAAHLFVPMDQAQANHLKAYGVAYWVLQNGGEISWLLNYRGGAFLLPYSAEIAQECRLRDVSASVLSDGQVQALRAEIASADVNMDEVPLQKAPRIAVYSPKNKRPWDDAVTMALTYAEIPYDVVYDDEVMSGILPMYDWLHLHHEDFTGQFGKFWARYRNEAWYRQDVAETLARARNYGFTKASELKLAVAHKIRDFVMGGGFLFAMCSAPDSYDVALAAEGLDICAEPFDGDPMTPDAQQRLDYGKTFAFTGFKIETDPYRYEISDIDVTESRPGHIKEENDFFTLFDFSAKWDWGPTMLCQNHERLIHGFMG